MCQGRGCWVDKESMVSPVGSIPKTNPRKIHKGSDSVVPFWVSCWTTSFERKGVQLCITLLLSDIIGFFLFFHPTRQLFVRPLMGFKKAAAQQFELPKAAWRWKCQFWVNISSWLANLLRPLTITPPRKYPPVN